MKKKLLSMMLALSMVLTLLPGTAFAGSVSFDYADGQWTVSGEGGSYTVDGTSITYTITLGASSVEIKADSDAEGKVDMEALPDGLTDAQKDALGNVAVRSEDLGLLLRDHEDIAGELMEAGRKALEDAGSAGDKNASVALGLSIEITDAVFDKNGQVTSLALEITAVYTVTVDGKESESSVLTFGYPIELTVTMPEGLLANGANVSIAHSKDGSSYHSHTAAGINRTNNTVTFTSADGLGPFTISRTQPPSPPHTHYDRNNDHKCDVDGTKMTDHVDKDADHFCDICDEMFTSHVDEDGDHFCDICDEMFTDHVDEDADGFCDICNEPMDDDDIIIDDEDVPLAGDPFTVTPEATTSEDGTRSTATVDETKAEELLEKAEANNDGVIVIEPKMPDSVTFAEVTIPAATIKEVSEKTNTDITVKTPAGSVTIPNKALDELGESGSSITVSVEDKDNNTTSVDIKVDDVIVDKIDDGIKVAIPSVSDGQVVVAVDADGNETIIEKSLVEDGTVYVKVDGSVTVKVVDNSKSFRDVDNDTYYNSAVDFVSSHELFVGTGDGSTFSPDTDMSRSMLVTVLWRLEGKTETGARAISFTDADNSAWYGDAMAWANSVGIVEGTGDGSTFSPDMSISREQLATMLYRYAGTVGLDTTARDDISGFADASNVSSWAADAMQWAVAVGLIQGGDSGLMAEANASRAQVATILERMVGLIVK